MYKNYDQLIRNVKSRTNPENINESVLLSESFSKELREIGNRKVLEYVKRSMHGVEPSYTDRTIEAGNKVKKHLIQVNESLDYKFQGSVMTNTHIRGVSDIDLIQITNRFFSHDSRTKFQGEVNRPNLPSLEKSRIQRLLNCSPFLGDANSVLKSIRERAEIKLSGVYLDVNTHNAKSIEVNMTSPKRTVDVVTASWYKSLDSVMKDDLEARGVEIYNKHTNSRLPVDFPFLKIRLLNSKDSDVNGRLKKMIRFLKNIKADSDNEIKLSSFDISSIVYNIKTWKYFDKPYYELVEVLFNEFSLIIQDLNYRNSIRSIDDTEPIFEGKDEKVQNLILLAKELNSIYGDLTANLPVKRYL